MFMMIADLYRCFIFLIISLLVFIVLVIITVFLSLSLRDVFGERRNLRRLAPVPKIEMKEINIPFTLKLLEGSTTNELHFLVSSQVCYKFMAYWGVPIAALHWNLWQPWAAMLSAIERGTFLHGCYQLLGTLIRNPSHKEKVFKVPIEPFYVGIPPRTLYPLVIFLVIDNADDLHPEQSVALINIVHLKDPLCELPTNILGHYIKHSNGSVSCLKELFIASNDTLSSERNEALESPDMERSEELCVVCQYLPFSRALLPCRHVCVCARCFVRLNSCPLCRSQITSYFCLRSEDYLVNLEEESSLINRLFGRVRTYINDLIDFETWDP